MLKIAKKYNTTFTLIKLSKNLKKKLPAWYHLGAPPKTYHRQKNSCLQSTHNAKTIKKLIKMSKRTTFSAGTTEINEDCVCTYGEKDQLKGCDNPHKCTMAAKEILNKITPKYNTKVKPKKDNLSLTHQHKEKNRQAHQNRRGEILFDPTATV
ncbi:hypothetical protein BDR06DRAFT_874379 [Suillus hirtellus]|nr:hypothetical protein BDR06DRAFT_874379 [Suillus hirtellus]